ncbi:ABC transporter substrate-binding protein [Halobacteriovorax sp.]|uniref:ABC transporter substrate-binding protein n=1 Tax=Halobacteriovorax sp. TaxID=2020862 RepID=UPI0035639CE2
MRSYPESIVCMTEESVEVIYALNKSELIVGVSAYVERPPEAKKKKTISAFTHANLKKIKELKPDLVLGFSDIQKDIARDLIGEGLSVFIANHRSVEGILNYVQMIGNLIGESDRASEYVKELESKISYAREKSSSFNVKPRVYIEEWDEPLICGIQWFSEIVELCGGEVVHKDKSQSSLATGRFLSHKEIIDYNPDIILACWCGKKVDFDNIYNREGYSTISAIKNNKVFELIPEIFLQPGPAPIVAGIDQLLEIFENYQSFKA